MTSRTARLVKPGFCRNGAKVAVMCGQTLGVCLSQTPLCTEHDCFPSENHGIGHEGKRGRGSRTRAVTYTSKMVRVAEVETKIFERQMANR